MSDQINALQHSQLVYKVTGFAALARPETGFGDEMNERKTEIILHVAPNLGEGVQLTCEP